MLPKHGKAMNIYQLTSRLDAALVKLGALTIAHKDITKEHGESVLWTSVRSILLEADALSYDILKEIKHPDLEAWNRRRGY